MSETAQYGVNKVTVHTVVPAGRIQRVSAAILVDDAVTRVVQGSKVSYTRHKRSQDELNKIQQIAEAVIGFDAKRGDTISVQDMSFEANLPDSDLPAPTWVQQSGKTLTEVFFLAPSDFASRTIPACLRVHVAPHPEASIQAWAIRRKLASGIAAQLRNGAVNRRGAGAT